MAKGTKVAAKFETYVAGMEQDAAFEAVSFFREVPVEIQGDVKETNKLRTGLIKDICAKYGVKPLGAAAPAGKTLDKVQMVNLWIAGDKMAKKKDSKYFGFDDVALAEVLVSAYKIKYPAHEVNAEAFLRLRAKDNSEDLLTQV
jgi:hypothetical protein